MLEWYEIVLLIVLGLFLLLVAVVLIRALLFNDKTVYVKETNFKYEEDDIVKKLEQVGADICWQNVEE
jgi:hypothetical protein